MMHKRILFSKIYVNVIFIFDRVEIWSKILKNKKFWAWENIKNKKFFEAQIGFFLRSIEPEPKKSYSYIKKSGLFFS